MKTPGVLYVRCPRCDGAVCSGIVTTLAEARARFRENVSFCVVCREWFPWDAARAEIRPETA